MENPILDFQLNRFSNNLLWVEHKIMPAEDFPMHWHHYFELEIILDGAGIECINGKNYEIKSGFAYLLRPADLHSLQCTKPSNIITISFDYSIIPNHLFPILINQKSEIVFYLKEDYNNIVALASLIHREYQENTTFKEMSLLNLLHYLLAYFIRQQNSEISIDKLSSPIYQMIEYISNNYQNNPSLTEIAEHLHLNPSYLSHLFKSVTKKNFTDYLTNIKIYNAKKLLLSEDKTIMDIAFSCGFDSLSTFNRVFKKKLGCSPKEYKKNNA